MIKALGPSFRIPLKSMLKVKSTKEAGKRYLEAILYNPEVSPDIHPNVFSKPGIK